MKIVITRDGTITCDTQGQKAGIYEYCFDGFLLGCPMNSSVDRFAQLLSREGPSCIKNLNGCFRGWVRNTESGDFTVFTDRYAGRELYVLEKNGTKTFHSDFNELSLASDPEPDPIGIAEFLTFQYPLYEKTFASGVSLFTPGSTSTFDRIKRTWTQEKYWRFQYSPPDAAVSGDRADALWELLEAAVEKCTSDSNATYGAGNSGGRDSRVILFIMKNLGREMRPYTIGKHPSDAASIASLVAKALGLENTIVPITHDFLASRAEELIRIRPMTPSLLAWHVSNIEKLPSFDVNITGFNGDTITGSHLRGQLFDKKTVEDVARFTLDFYSIAPEYFNSIFRGSLKNSFHEHFRSGFTSSTHTEPENLFDEFNFNCRQLRFVKNSPFFDFLGRTPWRAPFIDNDIMGFLLQMNGNERFRQSLYRRAVIGKTGLLNRIRFERRDPAAEMSPTVIARIKQTAFKLDRKIYRKMGKSFYFKGNHKRLGPYLLNETNRNFISCVFKSPNDMFDSIFDRKWITDNTVMMIENNPVFLSGILSVKMWCDLMAARTPRNMPGKIAPAPGD